MKIVARALVALVVSLATLFVSTGTSHAGLDNELNVVDGKGRTLVIQQWDTFLNGVFPLDRNRLTREWFHSGRANYHVTGPGADKFEGTLELGYQIGFPWSLGVGINFSYTTPNFNLDQTRGHRRPWLTRSPLRRCCRVRRSPRTWVTARVFRRWRRSRWMWPVLAGVWR